MKVFVTGGTGFIGGEVVRQLRDRGDEVVCLARSPEKGKAVAALGCELVAGDLSDEAALRAGMEGCDAVIHAAAMYEVGIPAKQRPAMREANVGGTERVMEAALAAKVPRIVYVSTVGVFGNTHEQGRRRDLRAPGAVLHLLLRGDQARGPQDRQADDRRARPAGDHRPARRRLRPRRHLPGRRPARANSSPASCRCCRFPTSGSACPTSRTSPAACCSRSTRASSARPT